MTRGVTPSNLAFTYILGSGVQTFSVTPYTDDTIGACFTYNAQVIRTSDYLEELFMTYDFSSGTISIETNDHAYGGLTKDYYIEIKDASWVLLYNVDTITVTFNFDCSSSAFDPFSGFPSITHVFRDPSSSETASIPSDTIGSSAGVLLQCGSRQFTFTD